MKDGIDLLVKFVTLVEANQERYGNGQQSVNKTRKMFELWLGDTCGMNIQHFEICYNHIQSLMTDANILRRVQTRRSTSSWTIGSIQTPAANTSSV